MLTRLRWTAAAIAVTLTAAFAAGVGAQSKKDPPQSYPTKAIRLIVPFPPGGGVDAVARLTGSRLSDRLGQNIVLDNRPGSGGIIAGEIAASAVADGYTLLFGGSATHGITPHLYKKLPYDPIRDFAPVVLIGSTPYILIVHPSVAAQSVKALIALAKANPGNMNYASPGSGSTLHLTAELFKALAGIDVVHVPHKGTGPALTDLLSARIHMGFNPVAVVMPHVKAGRLRALGVTSAKPAPFAPELPAIAEAGVPGFEAVGWYGVLAPARTPPAIVARLNREMTAMIGEPEFRSRLAAIGVQPAGGSAQQFAAYIASELVKWGKVVRASGARVD